MRLTAISVVTLILAAACASPQQGSKSASNQWGCPDGYQVKEGLNTNFPSDGMMRAFVVVPPMGVKGPAPVWVPLSGTVESANANLYVDRSGGNAKLADHGFMVIGPVRQCANQDPDVGFAPCDGVGSNGWNWKPWNDGRAADAEGDKWKHDAGPDSRFFEAMVRCVGTKWPLDARRRYIGGISAGGTVTNRALLFDSSFWAGGMPISGEWYVTRDDGTPLTFEEARAAVKAAPIKVHQGRVGPLPLPKRLDPMIVITVWGGEKDMWDCGPPLGLCSDYRPTTQAASNFYSSMPDIRIGGDMAFYSPSHDFIQLPPQEAYFEPINWYRTKLHELGHWTGHISRLDRDFSGKRGGGAYAREELVAELCSAFLCAELGVIPTVRHADYLGAWLDVLKADNRAIFQAASLASKAAVYIIAFSGGNAGKLSEICGQVA